MQAGMLLQGAAVLPSGRYSCTTRLQAGSFHCLGEVLLRGERKADTAARLPRFRFKVASCRALSNQDYYNNNLIIQHSKQADHNTNVILQTPEEYHGCNLKKNNLYKQLPAAPVCRYSVLNFRWWNNKDTVTFQDDPWRWPNTHASTDMLCLNIARL